MTTPTDTKFAIGTMQSKLAGATITKIIQAEPDADGNIHYGFEAMKDDKVIRAWVLADPEGNGPGYLDVCI
jgi:hypothetical protein